MNAESNLITEGFVVTFRFFSLDKSREAIEMNCSFSLHPEFGDWTIASASSFYTYDDLMLLAEYFEGHIASFGKLENSYRFLLYQKRFTLQAYSGYKTEDDQGSFTFEFMVNAGEKTPQEPDVFVGGMATVAVAEVKRFILSLKAVALHLQQEPDQCSG